MLRLVVLFLLLNFACFPTSAESLTSAEMEEVILGAWTEKFEMDGVIAAGISRYSPDYSVEHTGSIVTDDLKITFRFRSKWRIENDILITEALETKQPEIVAVGDIERDTILSMSHDQWTYREADGNVVTAVRLHESSPN